MDASVRQGQISNSGVAVEARVPSMSEELQTASRICAHLGEVAYLRTQIREPGLIAATAAVKQLQSLQFRATYADFLRSPAHEAATRVFWKSWAGKLTPSSTTPSLVELQGRSSGCFLLQWDTQRLACWRFTLCLRAWIMRWPSAECPSTVRSQPQNAVFKIGGDQSARAPRPTTGRCASGGMQAAAANSDLVAAVGFENGAATCTSCSLVVATAAFGTRIR